MKKNTAILWLLFASVTVYAQLVSGVYSTREATWFGIDFTKAKMIGDFGPNVTAETMRDTYFNAWNSLLVREKDKYNLPLFLHKQNMLYSLDKVTELNSAVEMDSIMVEEESVTPFFDHAKIQEMTTLYAQESKKGVGVLMVVESFNKTKTIAVLDMVFFDINTGRVYFTKRFSEKPHGAGLRNFWAKTVLLALEDTSSNWENWTKDEKKKFK